MRIEHKKVDELVLNREVLRDGRVKERVLALCETYNTKESATSLTWCERHGGTRVKETHETR